MAKAVCPRLVSLWRPERPGIWTVPGFCGRKLGQATATGFPVCRPLAMVCLAECRALGQPQAHAGHPDKYERQ